MVRSFYVGTQLKEGKELSAALALCVVLASEWFKDALIDSAASGPLNHLRVLS